MIEWIREGSLVLPIGMSAVKDHLRLDGDNTQDSYLDSIQARAISIIETQANRVIVKSYYKAIISGEIKGNIKITKAPLLSLIVRVIDPATGLFELYDKPIQVKYGTNPYMRFDWNKNDEYNIVGEFGYQKIPDSVQHLILQIMTHIYENTTYMEDDDVVKGINSIRILNVI